MNAEDPRLEAEASEVLLEIDPLERSCRQMAAAEFQKFEPDMARLHQRLAGLRKGMGLLQPTGSAKMRKQTAALAGKESDEESDEDFSFSGNMPKTVQLTGGCHGDIAHYALSSVPVPGKSKEQESQSRHVSLADPAGDRPTANCHRASLMGEPTLQSRWSLAPCPMSFRQMPKEDQGRHRDHQVVKFLLASF